MTFPLSPLHRGTRQRGASWWIATLGWIFMVPAFDSRAEVRLARSQRASDAFAAVAVEVLERAGFEAEVAEVAPRHAWIDTRGREGVRRLLVLPTGAQAPPGAEPAVILRGRRAGRLEGVPSFRVKPFVAALDAVRLRRGAKPSAAVPS